MNAIDRGMLAILTKDDECDPKIERARALDKYLAELEACLQDNDTATALELVQHMRRTVGYLLARQT